MLTILRCLAAKGTMGLAGLLLITISPFHAWAQEKRLANSLGMTFVLIPAGSFIMGSPPEERGRRNHEPAHPVTISRPFYMQTTEVTAQQWRKLMGSRLFFGKKGPDQLPVTEVSWEDSMEFIKRLNARNEGVYRLPTEAEWEYACRGGKTSPYPWGDEIDCSKAMYANNTLKSSECVEAVRSRGLQADQPAPVMSYEPNGWGLYDMTGNVWEWCQDRYGPYPTGPVVDPQGPPSGDERVRRGGSWYGPGERIRCANRNFSHFANRYQTTGFRLVREID